MSDQNSAPLSASSAASNSTKNKTFTCEVHAKNISKRLKNFYDEKEFFDIVLIAGIDNFRTRAHRIVLSASSDYFLAMFRSNLKESESDEIQLESLDGPTMKLILGFMYSASIDLSSDNVENVLRAADFFQMETLIAACCDFMGEQLDACNCLGVALFAEQHNYTGLSEKAFAFVSTYFERVTTEMEFYQLSDEQVSQFLSSDNLCVASEEKVFLSLVAWVDHDKANREQLLFSLLPHIRFTFLKPKFIIENSDSVCQTIECNELIRSWLKWHLSPESRSLFPTDYSAPRKSLIDLVLLSGYETDEFEFQTFNLALNQWSRADWPRPPKLIAGCGAIIVNKKLILAGGEIDGHPADGVDCLDLQTMEWSEMPKMNEPRRWPDMCVINGQLYVVGGTQWCSMERYNFATRQWEDLAPLPITSDTGLEIATLNGLLYVAMSGNCRLHCYDPTTDEWTLKASKYVKLKNIGMTAVKGYIYVVGGLYHEEKTALVERYDPTTNTWTVGSSLRLERSHIKCAAFNDRLIACGGFDGNEGLNLVEEYNPDTNEWKTLGSTLPHDLYNILMVM
ncbi:kelch-like protein 5 [Eupeodes corollae]|uniref:kelch-like protein 5 n=1 Tax=Eupeodes corollae TaxID=290404 RepID=UPI0024933F6A|nr:kelch-like protein 5 [Eupeodes corollae]